MLTLCALTLAACHTTGRSGSFGDCGDASVDLNLEIDGCTSMIDSG
jgi:tetratricopeptide (TPR) repeat protein